MDNKHVIIIIIIIIIMYVLKLENLFVSVVSKTIFKNGKWL